MRASSVRIGLFTAAFSLLCASSVVPTHAVAPDSGCGVWSNPPTSGNNVKNLRTGTFYPTLAAAVTAANSGDNLEIHGGSHGSNGILAGPVTIDKNIGIRGPSGARTDPNGTVTAPTIFAAFDTCAGNNDSGGWFVVKPGVQFSMQDVVVDGHGHQIFQAIRHQGGGNIDNVLFKQIKFRGHQGTAIVSLGGDGVGVSGSSFVDIGRTGILYTGSGVNATVSGIQYYGKGSSLSSGEGLDYAVDVEAGAEARILHSLITGCSQSLNGSASAGIQASTYRGSGTFVTINYNRFVDNTYGVVLGYQSQGLPLDTTGVRSFRSNYFSGNTTAALHIDTSTPGDDSDTLDVAGNYWGCLNGPGTTGSCEPITGIHASQVNTGKSPNVTFRLESSSGSSVDAVSLGGSAVLHATYSHPGAVGSSATYSPQSADFPASWTIAFSGTPNHQSVPGFTSSITGGKASQTMSVPASVDVPVVWVNVSTATQQDNAYVGVPIAPPAHGH